MKKRMLWIALALLLMSCSSSATNVSVTVVKDTVLVGETVELVLEVEPSESIGGEFVIREWVNETYGSFVRRLFSKPFPWTCASCSGIPGTPLKEPYKAVFHFIPTKAGSYNAEAYFRGTATTARDGRNFTVMESSTTSTTTTTTTLPKTLLCSEGGIGVTGTSGDTVDVLKLRHKNPEYKPGGTYYPKMDTTEDEIRLSGFEHNTFNVTFYMPEGLNTASIYVKAGAEDGLALETNFTINGMVIGGCTITGDMTDGVSGRWGECTAELDASNLTRKAENTLTVVTNLVPDMFKLSYADYDYMELRCNESGVKTNTTSKTTTTEMPSTTTMPPSRSFILNDKGNYGYKTVVATDCIGTYGAACMDLYGGTSENNWQEFLIDRAYPTYSGPGSYSCTLTGNLQEVVSCKKTSYPEGAGPLIQVVVIYNFTSGNLTGIIPPYSTNTTIINLPTTTTVIPEASTTTQEQQDGREGNTIIYAAVVVVSLAAFAVLIMKTRKER